MYIADLHIHSRFSRATSLASAAAGISPVSSASHPFLAQRTDRHCSLASFPAVTGGYKVISARPRVTWLVSVT